MAITSGTTSTVPVVAQDFLAVGLTIQPKFTPSGVTASLVVTTQRYKQATGAAPIKFGDAASSFTPDVFAEAAKDPAFAALVTQLEALIQTYVTSKGL